jgi:hypothetical protein
MANAALYSIITDGTFTLSQGQGGDVDFDVTFNVTQNFDPNARAVLSFPVRTFAPQNLDFTAEINEVTVVSSPTISDEERLPIQQVVKTGVLRAGQNRFRLRLVSGQGSLRFGDVVVFYGVNV